jgi:hypothetical protein
MTIKRQEGIDSESGYCRCDNPVDGSSDHFNKCKTCGHTIYTVGTDGPGPLPPLKINVQNASRTHITKWRSEESVVKYSCAVALSIDGVPHKCNRKSPEAHEGGSHEITIAEADGKHGITINWSYWEIVTPRPVGGLDLTKKKEQVM